MPTVLLCAPAAAAFKQIDKVMMTMMIMMTMPSSYHDMIL